MSNSKGEFEDLASVMEADRKEFESTARAGSATSADSPSGERKNASQTYLSKKGTFFSPVSLQTEKGATVAASEGPTVSDGDTEKEKLSFWGKCKNTMDVTVHVVQRYPSAAVVPLLLFCVLTALGIFGCLAGAKSVENTNKDLALSSAVDVGTTIILQVQKAFTPLIALQAFIAQQPNYYEFVKIFPAFAESLVNKLPPDTISELQVSPMGLVMTTYPSNPGPKGLDIFNASRLRPGVLTTMKLNELVLSGPLNLVIADASGPTFAGIARQPIFLSGTDFDEDWGFGISWPYECSPSNPGSDGCFNLAWHADDRSKFWGFVTALINMKTLTLGLAALQDNGYNYLLTRPATSGDSERIIKDGEYLIASSEHLPKDSLSVSLSVSNSIWMLYVAPDQWSPSWVSPVIAAVVIISFILAMLVAFAMIAKKQQEWMLQEVVDANAQLAQTTRKLAEEKVRTDALLVRQFNLIECFGKVKNEVTTGLASSSDTMDRIEAVRRQLNKDNIKSLAQMENIVTLEMLGQGMFGKVYKGLWRGTEVAVKTMVLPANMSGAEKREKMVVMEAAISSSLAHPNIVQTYTYNIKPITETKDQGTAKAVTGASQLGPQGINAPVSKDAQNAENASAASSFGRDSAKSVHGYEISMVLEYCDKGSLRDALDDGVFFNAAGLNYKGMLDVLADIAKAMLHLHSAQVLHADLKASNIMLKSSGEKRLVFAKVADFGLSVRMDHMETHLSNVYNGTLTHMAPEIMLDGYVSKAADVYAFGVTMWEVFTAGYAYKGTPRALLGHQITKQNVRPKFPLACPLRFRQLAENCWAREANARPVFGDILAELQNMRSEQEGPTPPIHVDMAAQEKRTTEQSGGGVKLPVLASAPKPLSPQESLLASDSGCGIFVGDGSLSGMTGIVLGAASVSNVGMKPELESIAENPSPTAT